MKQNSDNQNNFGYLKDDFGNKSSKRLIMIISGLSGIIMCWSLFVFAIMNRQINFQNVMPIIEYLFIASGSLGAINGAEKFFKRK
jgi:hypothetical protein